MGCGKKLRHIRTELRIVLIPVRIFIVFGVCINLLAHDLGTNSVRNNRSQQYPKVWGFLPGKPSSFRPR